MVTTFLHNIFIAIVSQWLCGSSFSSKPVLQPTAAFIVAIFLGAVYLPIGVKDCLNNCRYREISLAV